MKIDEWIARLCLEREEINHAIRALERMTTPERGKSRLHPVRRATARRPEPQGAPQKPKARPEA